MQDTNMLHMQNYLRTCILNVRIDRAAPRGCRQCVRQGGRGFKSAFKKVLNFAKKVGKNKAFRNISRAVISEAPGSIENLSKKVKNKRRKSILNSDITKTGVDLATGFALDKLQ